MAKDRVHPLKYEDPATGGTELDYLPTAADPNEDYYDGRGITVQNEISDDTTVFVERDVDDSLVLSDPVAGTYTLSELVSGGFDINDCIFDTAGWFVFANDESIVMRT
jgi:hypothetical protein